MRSWQRKCSVVDGFPAMSGDGRERSRLSRSFLSRWTAVLACFMLAGAGFAVWWPVQGARQVERLKAELRARGERFTFKELGPASEGGSESVNVLLQSLAARLEALGEGGGSNPVERRIALRAGSRACKSRAGARFRATRPRWI